ncbi:peptidoglycan-binding protein [Stigmatella erecta]|uniref:Putative peptidoglycan binding domain-containing protein n=1 Tax=Stigmatella erecta TaxID=83460 RepID=A0A1I0HB94_9BACT|nr:peptidoglycan-binding protein [Stigmatella erecta]SET80989.1 Putative peptidoglycan binding domain-containing protein [Stigmatella erecta]
MTAVSAARSATPARVSTTAASAPVLRQGATGSSVVQLQNLLRNHGHNVTADGAFGPKTAAAVKSFQQSRGLAADGVVGPKTWAALRSAPPSAQGALKLGSKGPEVSQIQQQLRNHGYNVAVDGDFGAKTQAAVKSFQQSRGLVADGIVGPKTRQALAGGVSQPGTPAGGKQVTAYHNGKPSTITVVPVGNGQYMRADAARNFKAMQAAAAKAGVNLTATSGFRSMEQQRVLYQKYLNGTGNLAAKPGYSNHQGGISMDIGGINGYGTNAYKWMQNNAAKYGFANDVKGEHWHWTYKGGGVG